MRGEHHPLRRERVSRGWTRRTLREYLVERGINSSERLIIAWESGESRPSLDACLALHELLGIPPEAFYPALEKFPQWDAARGATPKEAA